jgi:iron(III) transport system ATP-binding protein
MSAELIVENLEKRFDGGGKPAVDGVSFRVAAGEIVVLLGPSGCGKTTTLRAVAGLERPTAGAISIGGRIVSRPATGEFVPPQRRELGMVFQSYAVWPHMTVRQNIAYPLRHRPISRADAARKIDQALELVGLTDYAERSVVALSGGQMQRVALARSLVYDPQILLLDEPLSNLDAKLRLRLRDDLRRIIKDAGVTALYVTHDQSEAVVLGDRIGVMRDGKLLQMADAVELYNRPADPFVASFTGVSNLLAGALLERQGEHGTVALVSGDRITASVPDGTIVGARVQIAVRPENVSLAPFNGAAPAPNLYRGRVAAQRFHGNQTIYEIEALGARIEAIELGTLPRFAVGSDLSVTLPPQSCWGFPASDDAAREADAYRDAR